jgi:hypothetical protein
MHFETVKTILEGTAALLTALAALIRAIRGRDAK